MTATQDAGTEPAGAFDPPRTNVNSVYIQGENGLVQLYDLPLPDPIAERLTRGYLTRVADAQGNPYVAPRPDEVPDHGGAVGTGKSRTGAPVALPTIAPGAEPKVIVGPAFVPTPDDETVTPATAQTPVETDQAGDTPAKSLPDGSQTTDGVGTSPEAVDAAADQAGQNDQTPEGEGRQADANRGEVTDKAPATNAPKGEWVGWAVRSTKGTDRAVSADDADAMTKQDLIDKYGPNAKK